MRLVLSMQRHRRPEARPLADGPMATCDAALAAVAGKGDFRLASGQTGSGRRDGATTTNGRPWSRERLLRRPALIDVLLQALEHPLPSYCGKLGRGGLELSDTLLQFDIF